MSKSTRESWQELDEALNNLYATMWDHRWGVLAYFGGLWLIALLIAIAYEF